MTENIAFETCVIANGVAVKLLDWPGIDCRALARVCLQHGYTLIEIGREAGLQYVTASRIIKAIEEM